MRPEFASSHSYGVIPTCSKEIQSIVTRAIEASRQGTVDLPREIIEWCSGSFSDDGIDEPAWRKIFIACQYLEGTDLAALKCAIEDAVLMLPHGQNNPYLGTLWNLYMLCAQGGIRNPERMGTALMAAYDDLEAKKVNLDGLDRAGLLEALIANQCDSQVYEKIGKPLLAWGRHPVLGGSLEHGYMIAYAPQTLCGTHNFDAILHAVNTLDKQMSTNNVSDALKISGMKKALDDAENLDPYRNWRLLFQMGYEKYEWSPLARRVIEAWVWHAQMPVAGVANDDTPPIPGSAIN